ncbi:MAG: hypothetical protein ABSG55_01125 [Dehalococcoidia bacterium]|jgi:hypothetical protein
MRKMLIIAALAVMVALAVACNGGSATPNEQSGHGTAGPTESISDKAKSPEGMGELMCEFLTTHEEEMAYVLLHPDDQARLSYYEFALREEAALAEATISDCRVVAVMTFPNWRAPDLSTIYTNVARVTLRVTLQKQGDRTAIDLYPSDLVKVGEYWRWFTDLVGLSPTS